MLCSKITHMNILNDRLAVGVLGTTSSHREHQWREHAKTTSTPKYTQTSHSPYFARSLAVCVCVSVSLADLTRVALSIHLRLKLHTCAEPHPHISKHRVCPRHFSRMKYPPVTLIKQQAVVVALVSLQPRSASAHGRCSTVRSAIWCCTCIRTSTASSAIRYGIHCTHTHTHARHY